MSLYTRKKRPMSDINIVPYVDVMLVLLVIFMVTTPLMTQGVKVDLPRTSAEIISPDQELPVIISVNAEGNMFVDGGKDALDPNALVTRVAAELKLHPDKAVLVRGDRNVNYEKVVYTMALLQKAGVSKVGLMTAGAEVTP